MSYRGVRVLITGGAGFIGRNLAIRLVGEGARVCVVDPCVPGCGGDANDLKCGAEEVEYLPLDIADPELFRKEIESAEVIFNLAGEISHIHSMDFPERDLQLNTLSQLRFLMACSQWNRKARIVYAGTRQVYGVPEYLPMDEAHPVNPVDFNGIHKYAAAQYHLMLTRKGDLDAVVLRLTNVYGPRMALNVPCQGFLNTFFRKLLLGESLDVFGEGTQLRDPLYVDDAVTAFLVAAELARPSVRTYNVGGPQALSLWDIACRASALAGVRSPRTVPFPEERKAIDIGSYDSNSDAFATDSGFRASMVFAEGARRTLDYFRMIHFEAERSPTCNLPEHSGLARRMGFAAHS